MRSFLIAFVVFSLNGDFLGAQGLALSPDDPVEVERTAVIITNKLLRDVTNDTLTIRRARAIVMKSVYSQIRLPRDFPDRRVEFFRLARERDLSVRALLKSAKGRRQFDRNAAALWPAWAPVMK